MNNLWFASGEGEGLGHGFGMVLTKVYVVVTFVLTSYVVIFAGCVGLCRRLRHKTNSFRPSNCEAASNPSNEKIDSLIMNPVLGLSQT